MNQVIAHDYSTWLTQSENQKLTSFIQLKNGISICTGIIELWLSQIHDHSVWFKYATGIICLVKNSALRSYFFQLFDLEANLLWESEVYSNFEFKIISENFLCFPAKDCNAGFNFSYPEEAVKFEKAINKIIVKEQKQNEIIIPGLSVLVNKNIQLTSDKVMPSTKKTPIKNKKVSKMEIGLPVNFVHVNHIDVKSDSFDILSSNSNNEMIQAMKELLAEMNLKPTKRNLIQVDKLIKETGGYEVFNTVYQNKKADNYIKFTEPAQVQTQNNRYLSPVSTSMDNLKIIDDDNNINPNVNNDSQISKAKSNENIFDTINKDTSKAKTNNKNTPVKTPTNNNGDMLSQLKNALDNMRPFLDEDNDEW